MRIDFSFIKKYFIKVGTLFTLISPKHINQTLAVILGGMVCWVIYAIVTPQNKMKLLMDGIAQMQFQERSKKIIESVQPLLHYVELIDKRNIFSPFMPAKTEAIVVKSQAVKAVASAVSLTELAKDLTLVGISWGKVPQALIHSQKDNETYFVRQGQRIGVTEIRTKIIGRDKVVIKYEDQEMEL